MSFRVALSSLCRTWLIFEVDENDTKLHAIAERGCRLATSSDFVFCCHQIDIEGSKYEYSDKDTHHCACTSCVGTPLHRLLNTSRIDRCTVVSSLALTTKMSHSRTQ